MKLTHSTEPAPSQKNRHLYQLLRPELVKKSPVPLSSDAFSKLGKDKAQKEHNDEVKEATRLLETILIPKFAAYLDRRWVIICAILFLIGVYCRNCNRSVVCIYCCCGVTIIIVV